MLLLNMWAVIEFISRFSRCRVELDRARADR